MKLFIKNYLFWIINSFRCHLNSINNLCSLFKNLYQTEQVSFYLTEYPEHFKKLQKIYGTKNKNFILINIGSKKRIFVLNSLKNVNDIINYISNHSLLRNKSSTEDFELARHEILRYENDTKTSEILRGLKFKKIKNGIEINKKIKPNKIYFCKRFYELPKSASTTINKVIITTYPDNHICSIQIDTKHPNCDPKGYYCIDRKFNTKLSYDIVMDIIKSLEIYNFSSFYYYIPDGLEYLRYSN